MKKFFYLYTAFSLIFSGCSCGTAEVENGVTLSLARERKANLEDIAYALTFDIPENKEDSVTGNVEISFTMHHRRDLQIDYFYGENIREVSLPYRFENEHIVIRARDLNQGRNEVRIRFRVADQSLNRRDDFLYTLLVPDRARTLFPCFDQPDLKGCYRLCLSIPTTWKGIANSPILHTEVTGNRQVLSFAPTEPLSTYLFSFVAGNLKQETRTRQGRTISMYHKETDPQKTSQCDEIIAQVFASLDWLEDYTGIAYPFSKYDFIVLPGFQFGGMEHTGATLYNDTRMFLSGSPTLQEKMSRTELIAHETSHMWFGDMVTMDWFSEVWTKEVFANYFASKITAPLYPDTDHELAFMINYVPGAYSEDRTAGNNAIQQELENMNQAGLVYGNIIYEKSPVVMNMLIDKVGADLFQQGIREYLKRYAYANATWDDLIEILDTRTPEDLRSWSDKWLCEKGMPDITIERHGNRLDIHQSMPIRGQYLSILADSVVRRVYCDKEEQSVDIPENTGFIVPNRDGRSYGYFHWGRSEMTKSLQAISSLSDPVTRGSLLIMCHEAVLHGDLGKSEFIEALLDYIPGEDNQLLYSLALSYIRGAYLMRPVEPDGKTEPALWNRFVQEKDGARSLLALRSLVAVMSEKETIDRIMALYLSESGLKKYRIPVRDQISMCYELSIRRPEQALKLIALQEDRIDNPNLLKEFKTVSPAVHPSPQVRDSVFNALLKVENREVEPWARQALALLNHRLRDEVSRKYVAPGLEVLQEVQRTGDIFFPKAWASALLGGHDVDFVRRSVRTFFAERPDYPQMLKNKVMMSVKQ